MFEIYSLGQIRNELGKDQEVTLHGPIIVIGAAAIGAVIGVTMGNATGVAVGAVIGAFVGTLAVGAVRKIRIIIHRNGRIEIEVSYRSVYEWLKC